MGRVLEMVGGRLGVGFCELGCYDVDPALIAEEIGLFVSESPEAYMLIWGGNKSAAYTKIKDSAARNGMTVEVIDSKVLRNNPAYTFLLCRVSKSSPVRNVSVV